ncbi:uncharacterized protein [Montipora capricornis]|uniref:uncharacterized protein isoform X1 n=1 Tax=Montipora capricornis TaxID=246305 RepID=UPI0035F1A5D9
MFRSHFPFRLIRQSWTKSYSTISVKEVEEMRKKDVFFSLHLKREDETVNMAAAHAGTPLSASRLITIEGSSIQFEKLVPSLFEFLEKVTTNDRRDDEPKWEAFEVLENALQVLTCPSEENSSELTYEVLDTLRDLLLSESKSNTEAAVNLEIVNLILKRLTRAYIMLNKSHSKVFKPSKRLLMPESLLWDGLALGHRDAWYGELDMLIFTSITGEAGSKVALLGEKCGVDPPFDEDEEKSDVEEGSFHLRPPYGSIAVEGKKNVGDWSLFGSHFSQAFATAVTFSYVYHYKLLAETNSACPSFLPTVQVSPRGYQVFIYDCLQDVMFASNFSWSRWTLIYLWAILHHHLFFPAQLDSNLANRVTKFGYGTTGSPLFKNRRELVFGENVRSLHFKRREPQYGRMEPF